MPCWGTRWQRSSLNALGDRIQLSATTLFRSIRSLPTNQSWRREASRSTSDGPVPLGSATRRVRHGLSIKRRLDANDASPRLAADRRQRGALVAALFGGDGERRDYQGGHPCPRI